MGKTIIEEEVESLPVPKPKKVEVKTKTKYKVVKELPVQQIRQTKDEETGEITMYLTIEEALAALIGES